MTSPLFDVLTRPQVVQTPGLIYLDTPWQKSPDGVWLKQLVLCDGVDQEVARGLPAWSIFLKEDERDNASVYALRKAEAIGFLRGVRAMADRPRA